MRLTQHKAISTCYCSYPAHYCKTWMPGINIQSIYVLIFLMNRKGWRLDLKGTKRVLSPQSRSGKWTLKFNVILCASLTPPVRSGVHIQTKSAANFVAIWWSESFCLEHVKQCSITQHLSPCTHWIYGIYSYSEYGIWLTPQISSLWVGEWTILCSFLALIWEWVEQGLCCYYFIVTPRDLILQSWYF